MTDDDLKAYLDQRLTSIDNRFTQLTEYIDQRFTEHREYIEKMETKLLRAFHYWAIPIEARLTGLESQRFNDRLTLIEERLAKLEGEEPAA